MEYLGEMDALILCGGLGTRLRSEIGDSQKVLAQVNSRPFLDIHLDYLETQGFRRVILGTGYLSEEVERFCRSRKSQLTIEFSRETEPLGTGGAIKHAQDLIFSDSFFVLNGDSFCPVDFKELLMFHQSVEAIATIVVNEVVNQEDFGSIQIGAKQVIIGFQEKTKNPLSQFVNAGIYCFGKEIFSLMPQKKAFSAEKDFFPNLIGQKIFAFPIREKFLDIGTPERLLAAQKELRKEYHD